jgi:MFS family permease
MWYRRHESGLRLAIFFSAATLAGAFGGLLARGILEMRNVAGLAGWRWLFIIEGILTVVVGEHPRLMSSGHGESRRSLEHN